MSAAAVSRAKSAADLALSEPLYRLGEGDAEAAASVELKTIS